MARLLEADADGRDALQKYLTISGGAIAALALLIAMMPGAMTALWNGLFYSDIAAQKARVLENGLDWLARGSTYVLLVVVGALLVLLLRLRGVVGVGGYRGDFKRAHAVRHLADQQRLSQV